VKQGQHGWYCNMLQQASRRHAAYKALSSI
jgi:hypothetical protein